MQIQLLGSDRLIRSNQEGMFSLTDLWKVAGCDESKKPAHWQQSDEAQAFIKASARFLKCTPDVLFKSRRGKGGGTWAVEQIALEYAQYLSPELAVLVNQAFIERVEEEKNPELAIQRGNDRAIRTWKKQGKSDVWIEARMQGVSQRKAFTSTLGKHGVKNNGFRNCTNAVYSPLFGGTTEVIRHKKKLDAGVSVRDNLSKVELGAIRLAELLAEEKIENDDLRGNAECEMACTQAARSVASAIVNNRKVDIRHN